MQIFEPLQNPKKIQKPAFKIGSHHDALSSTDLISYFEHCIVTLGLVQRSSAASNKACHNCRGAEGGHRCTWSQHLAFTWSSLPAESLGEGQADWQDFVRQTSYLLLDSHAELCQKTAGRDCPTKDLQRAPARREPKSSQCGAKQPMPPPFKASISQCTQEDVLKLRTPPLCTAAQFPRRVVTQDLPSVLIYQIKSGN